MSRDEFAGMTLEFQVAVVNARMFGSTAAVMQERLSKLVDAFVLQGVFNCISAWYSSPHLLIMQVTLYIIQI